MKKQAIKLNSEVSVDIENLIQTGMVILANSGGGKSYLIRRIAEQAVENIQVILIDPEGEFASLREKYDFILAGKDADVPAEPRSAALLATKLLELNKSAVIDLYELHPQERQRFVKLFCDALVNCPKALYHPVIIILDEAHEYVPEGKPSEATWSVESLASKGRKRGQRLILASQRIAKISKNVTAECNNKLIGRASQDIDMKRAGDELGFSKEKLVELRKLKPGEFFAFGPSISEEVIKLTIGEVKTAHAKVGYKGAIKTPPPSDVIKKVLGELKDLPAEAEKEAKTAAEMKQQITQLKRELSTEKQRKVNLGKTILEKAVKEWEQDVNKWKKYSAALEKIIQEASGKLNQSFKFAVPENLYSFNNIKIISDSTMKGIDWKMISKNETKTFVSNPITPVAKIDHIEITDVEKKYGTCSKAIYSYLSLHPNELLLKTKVAVATGYSQNSGGFNNSLSELAASGLIRRHTGGLSFGEGQRREDLIVEIDTSLEKWLPKLGACARKIWQFMLDHQDNDDGKHFKERIAVATEYSVTSGGFNNSLSELSALGLIERMPRGLIRINPEILNL